MGWRFFEKGWYAFSIGEDMKEKNWLKDNIRSVLAIMWTAAGIVTFFIILFKEVKTNDNTTSMIITSLVGIVNFILGYYFGSSKSNEPAKVVQVEEKNEIVDKN